MGRLWGRIVGYTSFKEKFVEKRVPSVDVSESQDALIVKAGLPGLEVADIDVDLSGDILIIKGEKKEDEEDPKHHRHKERPFSSFQRSFKIPMSVRTENVEVTFEKGVLEVKFPKTEDSKEKGIKLKAK
jgi:HSP20 family protein